MGIVIQILVYADDIVLISNTPEGLQRHLNALRVYCTGKGLSINMDKTKAMVFNTTQAWQYKNHISSWESKRLHWHTPTCTYA